MFHRLDGALPGTERTEDTLDDARRRVLVLRSILPNDSTCIELSRRVRIGRDPSCELVLDFNRVSRRHLEIARQGPLHVLNDLGSTNGCFIDGQRVNHIAVRPGMLLRAGDWLGCFESVEQATDDFLVRELLPGLFGGREIAALLGLLQRVGQEDLSIVITAATGCGKERFARAAHQLSGRTGPFLAINCSALPPALAESELFGHARGAFTGAERAHSGLLLAANGGTLFLDELGDLCPEVQPKLLRAIELREVQALGATRPVKFDAAIVAATQQPLAELVAAGKFRADLAARLTGFELVLPKLLERRNDIPSLFHEFLTRYSRGNAPSVATKVYERLCLHSWPGNVRELEAMARRVLAEHRGIPLIKRRHLPLPALAHGASEEARPNNSTRKEDDSRRLAQALDSADGNITRASELAGISRQRAYRLMAEIETLNDKRGKKREDDG